jgi:hypothetical protein
MFSLHFQQAVAYMMESHMSLKAFANSLKVLNRTSDKEVIPEFPIISPALIVVFPQALSFYKLLTNEAFNEFMYAKHCLESEFRLSPKTSCVICPQVSSCNAITPKGFCVAKGFFFLCYLFYAYM